jgi:hypothetical protein
MQSTADGIGPGKTSVFQFTTHLAGTNPVTWQRRLTNGLQTHRCLFPDTNASHAPRRLHGN